MRKCLRHRRRVGRMMHLPISRAVMGILVVIEVVPITIHLGVNLEVMCLRNFVSISRIALGADIADIASNTRPRPSRERKDREDRLVTVGVKPVTHLGTLLPIRRVRVHGLLTVIILLNISTRRVEEEENDTCLTLHYLVAAISDPYPIYCCWEALFLAMLLYYFGRYCLI